MKKNSCEKEMRQGYIVGERDGRILERRRGSARAGIATVVVIIIVLVGGFCFGKMCYSKGFNAGVEKSEALATQKIEALGTLVSEKAEFSSLMLTGFSDTEALSETEIDNYISKLTWMSEKTGVPEVKTALENLVQEFTNYREVYAGGDAVAAFAEFTELKKRVLEAEEKIGTAYNQKIQEAVKF